MGKLSLKLGVAAFAFCAMAGIAQAGGDLDDGDDYGSYSRESRAQLCYRNPDHPRCDPDYRYRVRKPSYRNGSSDYNGGSYHNGGGACAATIRAAGKRNVFPGFARNSAIFSWQREVRGVHGPAYASWGQARRGVVSCGPAGGALTGCVATATPCRS
jgi:hypothetical protein